MNGCDIILAIPLIWGGYHGLKKGFIVELISSLLLVYSSIKGLAFFKLCLPILQNKWPNLMPFLPTALAILLLLLTALVIYCLTKLIKGMLMLTFLGMFDNLLGALFGLLKVAFFISLLMYTCRYLNYFCLPKSYLSNSLLLGLLEPIVPMCLKFFTSMPAFDSLQPSAQRAQYFY